MGALPIVGCCLVEGRPVNNKRASLRKMATPCSEPAC